MIKKMKEYFKGKNPFLLASAVIVILSVVIISMIIKNGMSADQETDIVTVSTQSTQQSLGERVEDVENLHDSEETKGPEASDKDKEEIFIKEEAEVSQMPESETESIVETQENPKTVMEQEETLEPKVFQDTTPEQSVSQDSEIVTPEESSVPEATPVPEVTPIPEHTPEPDFAPEPELTPIPDVTPAPEPASTPDVTPTPESTPFPEVTPESHEHSWIFESWYQEPTCSNGGLVMEICAHCGETQIAGGTPTGNHSYTVESPGDCCSQEVVVCTECNYREVREKDPGNHIDVEDGFCYGCGKKTD